MGRFWIGWGDICTKAARKKKEADVQSAPFHFVAAADY